MSRYHARIEGTGPGHYQVVDLDSTNGTYIGNAKLLPASGDLDDRPASARWDVRLRLVAGRPRLAQPRPANRGGRLSRHAPRQNPRSHGEPAPARTRWGVMNTQMVVAPVSRSTTLMLLNQGPIVDPSRSRLRGFRHWADYHRGPTDAGRTARGRPHPRPPARPRAARAVTRSRCA